MDYKYVGIKMELRATKLGVVRKNLQNLGRELTGDTMQAAMQQRGDLIRDKAKEFVPVATGELQDSLFAHLTVSGNNVYVNVGTELRYGAYVEYGTPPQNLPPLDKIWAWMDAIGKTDEDDAEDVLLYIATHIRDEGIKAQPFLKPAYEETKNEGKEIIANAVHKIVTDNWGRG